MTGPRTVRELLEAWLPGLSLNEAQGLDAVQSTIAFALEHARSLPATLDGRTRALIVTKLEEAEHWAIACTLHAVGRKEEDGI